MADPFAIAGGAIALAETGITIAKALKAFIDSVRKAEDKLRPVVLDVEIVSGLLNQIGFILENEGIRKICTTQFFDTAKSALDGCTASFMRILTFTNLLVRGDDDEIKMAVFATFGLYFK
jgi:hypothetical protein